MAHAAQARPDERRRARHLRAGPAAVDDEGARQPRGARARRAASVHPADRRQAIIAITAAGSALLDSERRSRDLWLTRQLGHAQRGGARAAAARRPDPRQAGRAVTAASTNRPHDPAAAPPRARAGMFRSLRVRNYRLYASGQLVSLTGTWMQRVAQDWLVLELTNSGTALGIVTALQFAPSLLLGLWGGVLADRARQAQAAAATQSGLALVALAARRLLDVTGVVAYWHVLVLAVRARPDQRDRHADAAVVRRRDGRQGRADQRRRHQLDDLQLRPHPRPGRRRRARSPPSAPAGPSWPTRCPASRSSPGWR